jgi:tubulin-folding cofactor B
MSLGQRCQVEPGGRRGRVEFIGEVEVRLVLVLAPHPTCKRALSLTASACGFCMTFQGMAAGYWVGVKFDEPVGRGDGTVKGKIMFKAEPKYGGFIRPGKVSVGDFPEKDIMADLEDSDDDEI